jgi:hypothetical protein
MSNFWDNCKSKKKCAKEPYNKLLANPLVKEAYDKYLNSLDANETNIKIEEFLRVVETREKMITASEEDKELKFTNRGSMSKFWDNCKSKKKCAKEPYNKLLANPLVKDAYDKYLKKLDAKIF